MPNAKDEWETGVGGRKIGAWRAKGSIEGQKERGQKKKEKEKDAI